MGRLMRRGQSWGRTGRLLAFVVLAVLAPIARAQDLDADRVEDAIFRAAKWQMTHQAKFLPLGWEISPLYDGLLNCAEATGNPSYLGEVVGFGEMYNWALGSRLLHADDHAVGHAWVDVYFADTTHLERLLPTLDRFYQVLAEGSTHLWTWCDALYMAPPTLSRLARASGDSRFLDFLDSEWQYTFDTLWDTDDHLFYRDTRFIGATTANGEKVFWARGNGWVFAGIPQILRDMPESRPRRAFYIGVFQQMAAKLASVQRADGLWTPSLLDPLDPDVGETSGSAFFVYGMMWGISHGLLDEATYMPVVIKGWTGLLSRQKWDGKVGYVQQPGDRPAPAGPEDDHTYGTGAFLLAGSEILKHIRPERMVGLDEQLFMGQIYADWIFGGPDGIDYDAVTILDWSGDDGNIPQHVFDGISLDPNNRWSVYGLGTPQWVEADLGSTYTIDGVVLYPYQNRDYQYTIEARAPGQSYQVIVDRTANTENGPIADDLTAPFDARYVKLTIVGADDYPGPWVSVQELQLNVDRPPSEQELAFDHYIKFPLR